jgi:hypothetical protein
VKNEKKSIQRRNLNYYMNYWLDNYIIWMIGNIIKVFQDSIFCIEEKIAQENK